MSKNPEATQLREGVPAGNLRAAAWRRARQDGYRESEKEYERFQEFPYAR
jgi:hypothetical protein